MSDESADRTRRVRPVLEYPCTPIPESGQTLEVAPGVLWIRMPLPFALSHINLWAIADGDRWAIVDTGIQTPETAAAWREVLAGPLGGRGLSRVMVTHMHPDHVGMAGWLTRKHQCALWMTRLEYLTCRVLVADTGREAPEDGVQFYRRAGWDDAAIEFYRTRFGGFGKRTYRLPDSFRRLRDGETIRIGAHDWTVVVGNGHSPEHACFHCPELKLLISGDQVLPRISSNVSLFPTEPDADPLGDWLSSLRRVKQMVPDDVLVLPAHNEPFRGLHARIDDLIRGHEVGLERLRRTLRDRPCRAIDVFGALFARRIEGDLHLLSMATGESLAHINHLRALGELRVNDDEMGVTWYRLAEAA
ncbi:MAG TPA: MBL fold metallo-hydrolase [Quisquiliibacterium sp.]|nr:MBL fold metallo-hydrolase [Quisquiliibacterium sp.]HPA91129.1 MBL fold metallo-hydrolase [Quisquiliibacterium sp.]HQD84530.1 MBL fold metallo-hydrolase [Quisquiliibacterium sp.]HQN11142.1 MBL fold metallo-hydrolase [Quisquiliibacterium sp.]HQP68575.1 MBL fold metallo-hydrolase [Quisquiliibacterium sp.]